MSDDPQKANDLETSEAADESVVPIVEETLKVGRREKTTQIVRVKTVVHEQQQVVDEPVTSTEVDVRRVPVELWVDAPVSDRMEGETLVISLHREVPVVQRRLQVFEEIHITPRRTEDRHKETVTLRREDVVVERAAPSSDD